MPLRYWALIVFLGALWGCSFLFNAILIRELGPLWVSAGRVSIGALGCWAFFVATRRKLPTSPRIYAQLLVLGVLNYAIPFALFPFAEQSLASGLVGVINGMTPMTTVLVSQLWPGGEKASLNKVFGVLSALRARRSSPRHRWVAAARKSGPSQPASRQRSATPSR